MNNENTFFRCQTCVFNKDCFWRICPDLNRAVTDVNYLPTNLISVAVWHMMFDRDPLPALQGIPVKAAERA